MSGFSLTLTTAPNEREQLIADLWEAGTTGVTEGESWVQAFFDEGADANGLMLQFADFQPQFEKQEEYDWIGHSQSLWKPFEVGNRFWLAPDWNSDPTPDGRIRLPIRPGLACGSGSHPATRLCLELMERLVSSGSRVLDIGTGSGILAEAALALGAAKAVGCDIEHDASVIAKANVPGAEFFTGSIKSVREGSFDIVVANLNAATLTAMAADLGRLSAGTSIFSGFKESEAPRLLKQLPAVRETLELDGWLAVVC